ncbi:hypothetical protein CYR75_04650 [Paracoccus jeotgali]|uniref:Uncharacterized protein n=1 Tax=Paracoccus jeotgali TaxID=2065379 RepID=A0A2K9MDE9_9RHOB|nr:hypothetical protein CYR75_04650 [Paracoccus jeotgali]
MVLHAMASILALPRAERRFMMAIRFWISAVWRSVVSGHDPLAQELQATLTCPPSLGRSSRFLSSFLLLLIRLRCVDL